MSTATKTSLKPLDAKQRAWLKTMGAALGVASSATDSGDFAEVMWQDNQEVFEETDGLVKQLEEAQLSKAALFRKGMDLIRNLARQKKYAEASKSFAELQPRIKTEYEKLEKSRLGGVRDLDDKSDKKPDDKSAEPEKGGSGADSAADADAEKYKKEILKVGSNGPAVEYLQKTLGGSLKPDGKFGPATQKAVKDFQTSKQLKVDGIVGPKTWETLGGGGGSPGATAAPKGGDAKTDSSDKEPDSNDGRPSGGAGAAGPTAPAKASGKFIGASVGKGGKNQPEDVKAVQEALNKYGGAKISTDGKYSPQVQKAIEEFQRKLGQFKPEGVVEPGRGTARVLSGAQKMPPTPAEPKPAAPPELGTPSLDKGAFVWNSTRGILEKNIGELKKGVLSAYGTEHRALLKQIDDGLAKLETVLDKLDTRLADSLAAAYKANGAARTAELKKSQAIMTEYIKYLKTEPLIKHMDDNPFGVKTNLQKIITDALTHLSKLLK